MRSAPFALALGCIAGLAVLPSSSSAQTPLTTQVVVNSGLSSPIFVTSPPGDADRLFVVQRAGQIRIIENGTLLAGNFLNISAKVSTTGERGLFSMAFHPNYASNGLFYVSYTDSTQGHASHVEMYRVSANPNVAGAAPLRTIFGPYAQPFSNHNGGHIAFGPDGMLYFATGDGGSGNDPGCRAQKGDTALGKMLRLDPIGMVPADNPYVGDPTHLDEIWHKGLRNPWRWSFDRATGDMYIGDVGQNAREEISFAAAGVPQLNFGWKIMEGNNCGGSGNCPGGTPGCGDASFSDPIRDWFSYAQGGCAVTGGYVYRGCAIPDLDGTYFYSDTCSGRIWTFRYDGTNLTNFQERTAELGGPFGGGVVSFGEDADGELYIISGGTLRRIVPNVPTVWNDLGNSKPGTNGIAPDLELCGLLGSGQSANLKLTDAAPSAPAVALVSFASNPTPLLGGIVVPDLGTGILYPVLTDGNGEYQVALNGGNGPVSVFFQFGVYDTGATNDVSFSNAIEAIYQP